MERDEIPKVWTIDRAEVIQRTYYWADGKLALKPDYCDLKGWPPDEPKIYTPLLLECCDRGGWFYGLFEGERLIAAAILDSRMMGNEKNQLQLKFLHVSSGFRNKGIGQALFSAAVSEAARRGAKKLYISAGPSEHTVNFYMGLGCKPVDSPNPELLRLEPYDIHLEYAITPLGMVNARCETG